MTTKQAEREHELSRDCWCGPYVPAYGDEVEYFPNGEIARVTNNGEVVWPLPPGPRRAPNPPPGRINA